METIGKSISSLARIELLDALDHDGCPLCWIVQRATRRYLFHILHEYVLDGDLRVKLHRSWGFCRSHAWALQRLEAEIWHDGMGTATLYEDLARTLAKTIQTAAAEPWKRLKKSWFYKREQSPVSHAVQATGSCPACVSVGFTERYMTEALTRALGDDETIRQKYHAGFGLCLRHFLVAVEASPTEEVYQMLLDLQMRKLTHLAEELEDYVRKHTVGHHDEPKGREQTSWIRVIELFVGKPEC